MPGLKPRFTDITDFCFCTSVVCIIKITLLIQNLTVKNPDLLTTFCIHSKFHISCDLLSEIHHSLSGRGINDLAGIHDFFFMDFLTLLRNQRIFCPVKNFCLFPDFCFKACIINLAVINLAEPNRTFSVLPGLIRGNNLFCAVLISYVDLCQNTCASPGTPFSVLRFGPARHLRCKPAFSNGNLKLIFFPEHGCDIILLILDSLFIYSPSRCQHIFSYSGSIKLCLIYSQCRDIKLRL